VSTGNLSLKVPLFTWLKTPVMTSAPIPWKHVRNVLVLFTPLWVGAVVCFGLLGAGYSIVSSDVYAARQPLVVRDEAARSVDRMGRFSSQSELKAAQETILEMAQNPEVVADALRQIGPPGGRPDPFWPTAEKIEQVAEKKVSVLAPKGSEFGNTEVVYLQVKSRSRNRASQFCRAMFDSLTTRLRTVRRVRADSIIAELTHARDLARQSRDQTAAQLNKVEIEFGTDLGELRDLNDTISGGGANRRTLEVTRRDLQAAELELEKMESLHRFLVAGAKNPQHLLISGGEMLARQPSLLRLKEGLIDAQLAASQLSGIYTRENPKRRASEAAEQEIKRRIQQEMAGTIQTMQPMMQLQRDRITRLRERETEFGGRLDLLANSRTDYSKLDAELRQRTQSLAEAERALAEAVASRSAALSTNLISELGPPQVTDDPIGPSGPAVTFGSMVAGLVLGLGSVFLIAPGPNDTGSGGRRWTDRVQRGRRSSDQSAGQVADRRSSLSVSVEPSPASPTDRRSQPRG
jgi:succinoglycan biosynthesis transport protein ExoP